MRSSPRWRAMAKASLMGLTPICVPSESISLTWGAVILLLTRVVSRFCGVKPLLNLLMALLLSPLK